MTCTNPQRHMPCHLSTYETPNKTCTSLDSTRKGESAHEGSLPHIGSQSVVLVSCFPVNAL